MIGSLKQDMQGRLAKSMAVDRKLWAQTLIDHQIPLEALFSILHSDPKTVQRFTWFIGDLADMKPELLKGVIGFLFNLKDQLSDTPGIQRSVAKWLLRTGIPASIESKAVPQLVEWVSAEETRVGCKSYACAALFRLATEGRLSKSEFTKVVGRETKHSNKAYAKRIQKLIDRLG